MDIEGFEFDEIRGGKELLKCCSLFVMKFIPFHLGRVSDHSIRGFFHLILEWASNEVYFPRLGPRGDSPGVPFAYLGVGS
jgi:hypothetical protein